MIDQQARAELCKRILDGDRQAARELAELYRQEGCVSLQVPLVRGADGDAYSWSYAVRHAQSVLGLPIDPI